VVATHGAAHSQVFEVECSIGKLAIAVLGQGASRRAAEQMAATAALTTAQAAMTAVPKRTRKKRLAEEPPQAKLEFKPKEPPAA